MAGVAGRRPERKMSHATGYTESTCHMRHAASYGMAAQYPPVTTVRSSPTRGTEAALVCEGVPVRTHFGESHVATLEVSCLRRRVVGPALTGSPRSGSPDRPEGPLPSNTAEQGKDPLPGGLKIRNAAAIPLSVEIRVGLGESCETATLITMHTLAPGRFLVIHSSQPLCVRRDAAIGGVARKQEWEKKAPRQGQVEEVEL
jgi:hypothetical protein